MKSKYFILPVLLAFISFSFIAADVEFKVDTAQSKVSWSAKKVTGEHYGDVNIKSGKLITDGKKISGGNFTMDMATITVKDLDAGSMNDKLTGHLKSDDFFSSEKFPESTLVITSATTTDSKNYTFKGNLTIKGITNEVEFPATVDQTKKQITAKAKITVNRTKYDIKYRSAAFFSDLGNKMIYDDFDLNVNLVATK